MGERMTFEQVLPLIKRGAKGARAGWNGKQQFVFYVPGSEFLVSRAPLLGVLPEGTKVTYRPHIDLRAVDGSIGVWQPSMSDVLADDWVVVGNDQQDDGA